jgi:hypothetical protein
VRILAAVGLEQELGAVAEAASGYREPGEELAGVVAVEPSEGLRLYVCAFRRDSQLGWLALDPVGQAVSDRALIRDAVSVVGLCELAEEAAGGGDLPGLRQRLAEVRTLEGPMGIDEAEAAAAELERTIVPPPRVASPGYLDAIGAAASRLERALGEVGASPFARAMAAGAASIAELADDVERNYKRPLG